MDKAFVKLPRWVQLILLLIPGVNYVVELIVRWSSWYNNRGIIRLVIAIIAIFGLGIIFGWIDFFCVLFTKKLFLQ